MPLARCIKASGTFGRPSGKRSNGFCAVYSINCSLLKVKTCACARAGASKAATHAHTATAGIDTNLRLALIVSFTDTSIATTAEAAEVYCPILAIGSTFDLAAWGFWGAR